MISEAIADHRLRRYTVTEAEATAKKPTLIGSPVVRYTDDAMRGVTAGASSQSMIEAAFDFANTHHGGEHLESTVFLKRGYPKNDGAILRLCKTFRSVTTLQKGLGAS